MKKMIFVLSLMTGLSTFGKEPITDKKIMIGFNIGTSANTAYFEDENKNDTKNRTKVGGFGGFTFEGRLADKFSLETGVGFVNKGASQALGDPAVIAGDGKIHVVKNGRNTLNFQSIEVPLIAKVYLGKKKIFNVNAGGFFSYAFKINMVSSGKDVGTNKNVSIKNDKLELLGKKMFNPIDAGVNLGFEFISQKGFGAGLKLNQGLVNGMNKDFFTNVGLPAPDKKMFHTGVQLYFIAKF